VSKLSTKNLKRRQTNFGIDEKSLALCALIFLYLGCIPAYFDFMFYAVALWIIGFAIMNLHIFVISFKKF